MNISRGMPIESHPDSEERAVRVEIPLAGAALPVLANVFAQPFEFFSRHNGRKE